MDTKQIQEATDIALLEKRLTELDVRKKERRLLRRKIARLSPKVEIKPKKPRAPRKKKIVEPTV